MKSDLISTDAKTANWKATVFLVPPNGTTGRASGRKTRRSMTSQVCFQEIRTKSFEINAKTVSDGSSFGSPISGGWLRKKALFFQTSDHRNEPEVPSAPKATRFRKKLSAVPCTGVHLPYTSGSDLHSTGKRTFNILQRCNYCREPCESSGSQIHIDLSEMCQLPKSKQ